MNRKILTVMMALAFAVALSLPGLALAGNIADVDQSGATTNESYITQIGGTIKDNSIDIDQIATTATESYNYAKVYQNGNGNDVDVSQTGTSNDLYVEQCTPVLVEGVLVGRAAGNNNILTLNQVAGTTNGTTVYQWGDGNKANVSQSAALDNTLYVQQYGDSNLLVGADSANRTINAQGAAIQISASSYNDLSCVQLGNSNQVGLYQKALYFNIADITQNGNDSLVAWQYASAGTNELTIAQGVGMSAVVIQNATSGNNLATITQQ